MKVSAKPREAIGTETPHSKTHLLFLLLAFQFTLPNVFCTAQLWTFNFCCPPLSHADTAMCRWGRLLAGAHAPGWRHISHAVPPRETHWPVSAWRLTLPHAVRVDSSTGQQHLNATLTQPDKLAVCLCGWSHSVRAHGSDVMNASSSLCRGSLNQTRSLAVLTCECPARR